MSETAYVTQAQFEKALDRIDELEQRNEENSRQIAELKEKNAELREEVDRLSTLGDGAMQQIKNLKGTVDDVEATIEDATMGVEASKTTLQNTLLTDSPLEQVTGLTEQEAMQNLSSNQFRARTIAMNIPAIAKSAEAGYVIDNSTLRSELTKIKGERPNDNDVKRVRDFLNDLGKDHVDVVDHRGSKMVVVEKAYAKQLGRTSYSPEECLVVEHRNNWRDMLELQASSNGSTQASAAV